MHDFGVALEEIFAFFMPKETEARLIKNFCNLNKEQHWVIWANVGGPHWHIFKTLRSVDY